MLMVTINAYDPGSHQYDLVCDTRLASQIDEVQALFCKPGHFGMNYRYQVLDRVQGRAIAQYFSDRLDMADALRPNYRHVSV
ncbi:MAG: hypothetical protein OEZ10_01550 [Gammaproteobacteria bacterium]|nr:hypothetical protein [Gammaproteobacteria bacterium]